MSTIAVVSAGAMDSTIAKRLVSAGCTVYTNLDGRSSSAHQRALDAGMTNVPLETLVSKSQWILSIVLQEKHLLLHRRSAESLRCPIPLPFHALLSILSKTSKLPYPKGNLPPFILADIALKAVNLGEYDEDYFNLKHRCSFLIAALPIDAQKLTDHLKILMDRWDELPQQLAGLKRRKAKAKNGNKAGAASASTPSASADAALPDDGAGSGVDGSADGDASRANGDGDTTRGDNAQGGDTDAGAGTDVDTARG
ncbi:hypothetical protein EDB19DRAFT_1911531 [Suillus lakei]|nr:hypothetical protein EDB19DRAFT_1911531 [Suillus lakei]